VAGEKRKREKAKRRGEWGVGCRGVRVAGGRGRCSLSSPPASTAGGRGPAPPTRIRRIRQVGWPAPVSSIFAYRARRIQLRVVESGD
jgi:hypothetical protein